MEYSFSFYLESHLLLPRGADEAEAVTDLGLESLALPQHASVDLRLLLPAGDSDLVEQLLEEVKFEKKSNKSWDLELSKIQIMISVLIDIFEDITDVLNANVVCDSFEEDDDLIQTEVGAPVSIDLIEQLDEILVRVYQIRRIHPEVDLFQRGGVVRSEQVLLGRHDERVLRV